MKSDRRILIFSGLSIIVFLCFHCDNTDKRSRIVSKNNSPVTPLVHSPIINHKHFNLKSDSKADSLLTDLEKCITPDSQISLDQLSDFTINDTPIISRIETIVDNDSIVIHLPSAPFLKALLKRINHPQFIELLQTVTKISGSNADLDTDIHRKLNTIRMLERYPVLFSFMKSDLDHYYLPASATRQAPFSMHDVLQQSTTLAAKFGDRVSIRFWAECEEAAITEPLTALLDSIAAIIDLPVDTPENNKAFFNRETAVDHYFDTVSFNDPDAGVHSILDCRNELVESFIDDVVATMYGDTVTVKGDSLHTILSAHSYYFNPSLRYYALRIDDMEEGNWCSVSLKPELTFIPQRHCSAFSLMIRLSPEKSNNFRTVLYAALPPEIRRTPTGYFPLKSTIAHFRKLEPSDTDQTFLQTTYRFTPPSCEKCVKEIHITGRYRLLHQRDRWNDTLRQVARLKAITKEGDTLLLHEEKAFGTTLLHSAYIGNPVLSDVNADGRYDILIEVNNGGRLLLLQREGIVFEPRKLRNRISPDNDDC